jgi:hypothetical protein
LYKGDKFDWTFKDDTYTLIIKNPTTEEEGTYLLFVRELDMKTTGHLTVNGNYYYHSLLTFLIQRRIFPLGLIYI